MEKVQHRYVEKTTFSGNGNISKPEAKLAESERLIGQLYAENAFSRKCIGWKLGRDIDSRLAVAALDMALKNRKAMGISNLIHHSDQGVQYASWEYIGRLKENNIQISMSRKGNPYDNAFAESFIKTLKYEEVLNTKVS